MSATAGYEANDVLLREDAGGAVTLTLNRPKQFNSLSDDLLRALKRELDDIARDDDVRCVVIKGDGPAFCAGQDLKEMRENRDEAYYARLFAAANEVMMAIVDLPVPVIARVHGLALAAGVQLIGSCDIAVAASSATFAVSGIKLGLFCSTPAVALSRSVGPKRAFEMLIRGRTINAEEALAGGLLSLVVPDDQLEASISSLTVEICSKSPVAVRTGKAMFGPQRTMSLRDAYDFASKAMIKNMMAADAAEGMTAFVEKRKPVWTGR